MRLIRLVCRFVCLNTDVQEGSPIVLPKGIGEIHHELELGVVIGKTCRNVAEEDWEEYVGGYCLALDL